MNDPTRLIVSGMHRSGTSFVASLLAAWGVRMGDRLLPADGSNPTGYFEDIDFLDLNRRILITCTPAEEGHRDWGWTESERFDRGVLESFRDPASTLVAAREAGNDPWGWKDPRTSMLLDFWDGILERDACFLLVYRQPWEVADSMLRTGAAVWLDHPDYPARIWTAYNRRILDFHQRNRDRSLLISANRLLRDPEIFATMIRRRFGIDATARTFTLRRAEASFVSWPDDDPLPRLWRHTDGSVLDLLGALDDTADLGNDRRWEAPSLRGAPQPPDPPRLSVVVPCHDDGDYVIDAVASVERNAPAAEIIIVDDGSTQPRTLHVLEALREAGHPVIAQPHGGLPAARNRGIAESRGEFFLPLDADNRVLPSFIEEAMALLDREARAGVVYGNRREFGARRGDVEVPDFDLPRLLWSNYIDACAVVRRSVWNECGGYDLDFPDWEDWNFWLSAASRGWRFVRIARPAFEYRLRPGSLHQRFLQRPDHAPTLRRVYATHAAMLADVAAEALIVAHGERRQLWASINAFEASRDALQVEVDRLAASRRVAPAPPRVSRLARAAHLFSTLAHSGVARARLLMARLIRSNFLTRHSPRGAAAPSAIPSARVDAVSPSTFGNPSGLTRGVNVYGYAFAESGTGQIVRSVVAALAAEGIPYAVVPFTRTVTRQQTVFEDRGVGEPCFDTNLICVNADQVPHFFESMGDQLLPGARNIGLWAWEVEDFPPAMARSERYFAEVWGISRFTAGTLSRCLTRPVRAFPLPVVVPDVHRRQRAELALPEGFLFLFCFDYDSVFRRKNPLGVVAAFRAAFGDRADVVLYIKSTNADRHVAERETLRAAAAGRTNIVVHDTYVSGSAYFSMLDACDCYVSLHRAEGFGLTVADAMALGKPVISTAYASTVEFANESNSFPVPATLVEVGYDSPPYPPHARWAEPDLRAAAEQMARVVADTADAAAVGARAREDIAALHGPSARGRLLRRLLDRNDPADAR